MKPIPKALLIHSAELKEASIDSWQNETLKHIASLTKVRIEPSSKLVTSKDNKQISLSAVLFYDCCNSRPNTLTFSHGQKIIFNGIIYSIETIEHLYDGTKLHHYELGLI